MIIEIFTSLIINLFVSYINYDYEHVKLCNHNILVLKHEINDLYQRLSELQSDVDYLKSTIEIRDDEIRHLITNNYIVHETNN